MSRGGRRSVGLSLVKQEPNLGACSKGIVFGRYLEHHLLSYVGFHPFGQGPNAFGSLLPAKGIIEI